MPELPGDPGCPHLKALPGSGSALGVGGPAVPHGPSEGLTHPLTRSVIAQPCSGSLVYLKNVDADPQTKTTGQAWGTCPRGAAAWVGHGDGWGHRLSSSRVHSNIHPSSPRAWPRGADVASGPQRTLGQVVRPHNRCVLACRDFLRSRPSRGHAPAAPVLQQEGGGRASSLWSL